MATQTQLLDIATLIQIRMDNNYQDLVRAVNAAGYNVTSTTPQGDMMKILVNLYKSNPSRAIGILRGVPYNASANNYTTSDTFKNKVIEISGETAPSQTAKMNWDWLQALYKPETTTSVTNPTITSTPTNSTAIAVGIVAIAIAIVVLAYIMFK